MTDLNLGSIKLPINSVTKTFAILAKKGAGKTYTGAVFTEELFKNNISFVVFDPIDVWWGLRLNKDGKSKGLPIVVFGLEHADIKIDRDMGELLLGQGKYIDGKTAIVFFAQRQFDKLIEYCTSDVELTERVYLAYMGNKERVGVKV